MPKEWVWVINPHGVRVEVDAERIPELKKKGYSVIDPSDSDAVLRDPTPAPVKSAPTISTEVKPDLLMGRSRLNKMAIDAGVPNPKKLSSKQAVIDAINANR